MNRILIIDDDQFVADLYRQKLELEGYQTEICPDGREAIKRLQRQPPDLVVLDVMLPGVSGAEVLSFIRAQPSTRTLPVIVLSNAQTYASEHVLAAGNEGANVCLAKADCAPNQLCLEVRAALAAAGKSLSPDNHSTTGVATPAASPGVGPAKLEMQRLALSAEALFAGHAATASSAEDPGRFQAAMRAQINGRLPEELAELRSSHQSLNKADTAARPNCLLALSRLASSVASMTSLAGLVRMAQVSRALEALVAELIRKPAKLNPSALRTMAQAIDFLSSPLAQEDGEAMPFSPLIMVIDDEPLSRETICTALEKVRLRATSLGDASLALQVLAQTRYDLVFADVNMPGLHGFDACEKLHATTENAKTPVVFVTSQTDFDARIQSAKSGGADFITKPVALLELALKTLLFLNRPC